VVDLEQQLHLQAVGDWFVGEKDSTRRWVDSIDIGAEAARSAPMI
jgi:hypothetical protein